MARLLRRTTTIAALGALALTAAGCGSSSSGGGGTPVAAIQAIHLAASTSTASPGYKMALSMQLTSAQLPSAISATGNGAFEPKNRTGEMSISLNLGNIPGISAVLGSNSISIDEILNGLTLYMKLPSALASKVPGSKPWLKMDLSKAAAQAGIPGLSSLAGGSASEDPSQFLQYLTAASGNVQTLGSATINGVQTTHYRATIQLDKVASQLPAASRTLAQSSIASLEQVSGLHQIPVDVWIDSQHLVRRLDMAFTEHVSGTALGIAMQIYISQYGAQAAPQIPAANQTGDLLSMLGNSLSGLGGTTTTP